MLGTMAIVTLGDTGYRAPPPYHPPPPPYHPPPPPYHPPPPPYNPPPPAPYHASAPTPAYHAPKPAPAYHAPAYHAEPAYSYEPSPYNYEYGVHG